VRIRVPMVGAPHKVQLDGVAHPRRTLDGGIRWADGTRVGRRRRRAELRWGVDGESGWRLGVRRELSSRRLLQPLMQLELVSGEQGSPKSKEIHGIHMITSTQLVSIFLHLDRRAVVIQIVCFTLADMCFKDSPMTPVP
jgi:hypothetical protein